MPLGKSVLGRLRLHPLFLLLAVLAVGAGYWRELVVLFLLVMLHELGHAAMASHFGYEVEEVSLLPFGGVARLSYGGIGFAPRSEAAIAIAGPLVNFCLVVLALSLQEVGLWTHAFAMEVIKLNLWIALFNLLPGFPLDGGRVLRAARSRTVGYEQATLEAYRMSIALSVFLLCLGGFALWAGYPHVGILILGVFLFVTAWTGRKQVASETVRFLDTKRRTVISPLHPQKVRTLAVTLDTPVRDVVRQFAPERYHLVYVLNGEGRVSTIVEEQELLDAVFQGDWLQPIRNLIHP